MVRAISKKDYDGAVDFVCASTDAISTWDDGCEAACPEGYGAGSTMTIVDESANKVTGYGWFSGTAWATL